MTLKEIIDRTTQFFKDKKFDSPRLDAELLIAHGLKIERIQIYLKFDQPLDETQLQVCRDLVKRRIQGEPVAYILGYKEFFGERFIVNPNVLIPRPETEHVVEAALDWAKDKTKPYKILDLGTGSGCIGLTLLKKLPNAQLTSVDISGGALEVAQQNAAQLKVESRVQFVQGDALEKETSLPKFDIIVSNPPYVAAESVHLEENVKKFEPASALFAEDAGLKFLKNWSEKYRTHLNSESIMLMEMGFDQGPAMKSYYESLGCFQTVKIIKDLSGHDRVISGVKHG